MPEGGMNLRTLACAREELGRCADRGLLRHFASAPQLCPPLHLRTIVCQGPKVLPDAKQRGNPLVLQHGAKPAVHMDCHLCTTVTKRPSPVIPVQDMSQCRRIPSMYLPLD